MANPPPSADFRNISVLARNGVLHAIAQRASERGLSLNKAATSLIEEAITLPEAVPATPVVNLECVPTDDLIDELVGRLQQIGEVEALTARAEAAEAKLLKVASIMGGSVI